MSRFLHFTVAVEYNGKLNADQIHKLAHEIEQSLVRHADTVAVGRQFDRHPKVKYKVLPVEELPHMRDDTGWHLHDNDGACTPCVRLYEFQHEATI